jgi:hypothetical protein
MTKEEALAKRIQQEIMNGWVALREQAALIAQQIIRRMARHARSK